MVAKVVPTPKRTLSLYLPAPERARLDALAEAGGISRSSVLRRLLALAEGATPAALSLRKGGAR